MVFLQNEKAHLFDKERVFRPNVVILNNKWASIDNERVVVIDKGHIASDK